MNRRAVHPWRCFAASSSDQRPSGSTRWRAAGGIKRGSYPRHLAPSGRPTSNPQLLLCRRSSKFVDALGHLERVSIALRPGDYVARRRGATSRACTRLPPPLSASRSSRARAASASMEVLGGRWPAAACEPRPSTLRPGWPAGAASFAAPPAYFSPGGQGYPQCLWPAALGRSAP